MSGQRLHSPPNLLYLADTQLGLIEQYKMFVKVGIIVQDIAAGLEMRVPAGPSRLLHIIFQRIGDVIMNHQADILLVHAHSEC